MMTLHTYQLIHVLSPAQAKRLTELYQLEWWTCGRTLEQVTTMLAHSDQVFGLVTQDAELIGFTRVLSDYVFKALILDVIVVAEHRGEGLGRYLMEEVLGHSALAGVKHFELYCLPEMVPFYESWDFAEDLQIKFLRRT